MAYIWLYRKNLGYRSFQWLAKRSQNRSTAVKMRLRTHLLKAKLENNVLQLMLVIGTSKTFLHYLFHKT